MGVRRLTDKGKVCAALILVLRVSWVALSTALLVRVAVFNEKVE